jgi:CHAT domain-containing protein/Flp pilus assembly protein TadD
MAAMKKTFEARENGRPKFVSRRMLVLISLLIVGLAAAAFLINRPRGSRVERGTRALIEAFSKRRLIEPRLSGGFKRGEYKPDDPEPAPAMDKAREPILDAVASGEPGADLAYARLLLSEGEKDPDAIKHLRLALAVSPDSAEVNNDLGVALFLDGKLEDALHAFEEVLKRHADIREALFNRGLCYERLLLRDEAAADYRRLQTIESDPGWLSEINHRLAETSASLAPLRKASEVLAAFDAALDSGNIDEAKSVARQNLEVVNKFATNGQTVEFLRQAAAGEHQKAEHSLWKIEMITRLFFEATGDASTLQFAGYLRRLPPSELSRELKLIGDYLESTRMFTSKNYSQAQVRFEDLSKQFASRGNDWLQVNCACYASFCLYASGHLTASVDRLKDVLRDISSRKWAYLRGHILLQLGGACARLGQDSLAIRYCEENLKNKSVLPLLEAKSLQYMGNAYWHLGDLDKALTYLRRSTESYLSSVPAPEELGYNYLQLADIYRLRGNHSLALLDAQQAIVFLKQTNDNNHASQAASFTAVEYARLGESELADKSMNEAFGYLKKTNPDLQTYSEPLLLTRAGEMAATRGDTKGAVERYQQAEALVNKSEDKKLLLMRVLTGRAEAYANAKEYDKARNDLARGIDLIERYRSGIAGSADRSAFLDASQGVFDQLISLNIGVFHREPDAFNVSEESRARTLLDELASRKDANSSRTTDSQSSEAGALRLAPAVKPLGLKAVQKELPDDVRLLTYSLTPKGTYVFLVTRSRFEVATSPATTETLDRLTADYVSGIERLAPIEALSDEARELYRLLIKPIETQIGDGKRLCIVPDKALHFLPFAALVDETGRYLVESHRLSYAPSASALVNCLRVARTKGPITREKIFAVGNPRFDREAFPKLDPLPDSEREANTIGSFYSSSVVRTGEQATRGEIEEQLKDCDLAHLAVHCLVEEKSPWLAALVLSRELGTVGHAAVPRSQSHSDDGLLYLNEIYGFSLPRIRLVVLSACRSGLGQYYRGEGIVSLARPFLALRVPTVVASLWSVDSEATAELMIEFHRRRTAGNQGTSDALCDAQITLAHRASYAHPYYWAPFITLGSN